MSQVYRDLVIDFSITVVSPKDALMLRNSVQAVLRSFCKYFMRSSSSPFLVYYHNTKALVSPESFLSFLNTCPILFRRHF